MSCLRPLLAIKTDDVNEDTGKRQYIFTGVPYADEDRGDPYKVAIPCGKCLGCRIDYSRQWANRMIMELDHHNGKAVFATLTYDPEHVPKVYEVDENGELTDKIKSFTLDKRDAQLFLKKLRSRKKFEDREIRFYLSGEYGEHTKRPHMHCILFGISLDDFEDLKPFRINELKQQTYISDEFADIWSNGFIVLSDVSWETMAYVSRYVQKKANANNDLFYEVTGVLPEFSLMSLKPGIGSYFYEDHPDLKDDDFFYVNDGSKRIKLPVTKNLMSYLEKNDPERYNELKESHKLFSDVKLLSELKSTDLAYNNYLALKEQKLLSKVNSLRRVKV